MNEEINQEEMTPEEAKASLGLATRLSEQFMLPQEAPVPQGEELGLETTTETPLDQEALKTEITDSIKKELRSIVQEEISSLRKDIQDALKDEQG